MGHIMHEHPCECKMVNLGTFHKAGAAEPRYYNYMQSLEQLKKEAEACKTTYQAGITMLNFSDKAEERLRKGGRVNHYRLNL